MAAHRLSFVVHVLWRAYINKVLSSFNLSCTLMSQSNWEQLWGNLHICRLSSGPSSLTLMTAAEGTTKTINIYTPPSISTTLLLQDCNIQAIILMEMLLLTGSFNLIYEPSHLYGLLWIFKFTLELFSDWCTKCFLKLYRLSTCW